MTQKELLSLIKGKRIWRTKSKTSGVSVTDYGHVVDVHIGNAKHPYVIITDNNITMFLNEEECLDLVELGETKHISLGNHSSHWERLYLRERYHLEKEIPSGP